VAVGGDLQAVPHHEHGLAELKPGTGEQNGRMNNLIKIIKSDIKIIKVHSRCATPAKYFPGNPFSHG
jgi:hypothetical protein